MKYIYDDFTDSVVISSKKDTDRVKGSVKLGDFIIDLTREGKVVGLEIRHFSTFLKESGIDKPVEEMKNISISVSYKPDSFVIIVYVAFEKQEKVVPIRILTETPKMAVV